MFLGIITGRYGSGQVAGQPSILHQEVRRAIELDKSRWFLVHHDVTIARQVLKQFRFRKDGKRRSLAFEKTGVLDDIRVLDMYDEVLGEGPADQRTGNWAQTFRNTDDVLRFIATQFGDPDRIRPGLRARPASGPGSEMSRGDMR